MKNFGFNMLRLAVLCTKHPGFHEEREWRVVATPAMHPSPLVKADVDVVRGIPQVVRKISLQNYPDQGLFEKGGPLSMVNIDGKNYVAATACASNACSTRRVLLLIGEGGSPLLARLEDGVIPHYYAYGSAGVAPPANAATIADAGLRALQSTGGAYP